MKPLSKAVIIELVDPITERMTESGLYIAEGSQIENFSEFEEAMADTPFKKNSSGKGDLINKLVETSKRRHGKIPTIDVERKQIFEEKVSKFIDRQKGNYGRIVVAGDSCNYFNVGNFVHYKGQMEILKYSENEKEYALVMESDVLAKKENDTFIPHPDFVLVKITKESRESLFKKKIKRLDGSEVELFVNVDSSVAMDRKSEIYVAIGEIVSVGENVKNVYPGDTALLHYLADNNADIIIGFEGEAKLIGIDAVTTYHADSRVIHESRKGNRTQIVWQKGDYDNLSSLIGTIHGNEMRPREPFVILEHLPTTIQKVSEAGLLYLEREVIIRRKVLAVSEETTKEYGIEKAMEILVNDLDTFDLKIGDGKVSVINDQDVLCYIIS